MIGEHVWQFVELKLPGFILTPNSRYTVKVLASDP